MFKCKNCKSVDKFELMLSPDYQGKGNFSQKINDRDEIIMNVDGYEFVPDLDFMNNHAVCRYCGSIGKWECFYPKFHKK
ncbi:MAG: hypothetical protein PHV68_01485 [Candidatus Gastranaerophilales bacterium]|nr:hypothetical protein [Candidatus Gastranaerophilales bacterium]